MSLTEKINQELTTAMKSGQTDQVAVLRLLKTGIKNEQIKLGHELSDDEAIKVLQKEAKQRRDSIEAYKSAGREELAAAEAQELEIISSYLPQQMDEAALSQIIDQVISDTGASSPTEMGVVIGAVMKQVAGRADGATVSTLVRQKLSP